MGATAAMSAVGFSATAAISKELFPVQEALNKKIRIGIIGAENSHTIGYGKIFNIKKQFPGVEVRYVWGETVEFVFKTCSGIR